jgi:hypothetical protein
MARRRSQKNKKASLKENNEVTLEILLPDCSNFVSWSTCVVGTMLRRRRSCGKKQLRLKLLEHDAEDTVYEALELQHIQS